MADKVELTNLDKVFWPKLGITKGDLVDYYRQMADIILPYLADRPHSLLRQPGGIKGESFFQKNVDHAPPKWLKTIKIRAESTGEDVHYLVCKDLDHLLYMVQLGCIEINPWNSRVGHLNKPDWLILDLDPVGIGFDKVIETALVVKKVCDELKILSFPKTSGKTGIHVYIPTKASYKYEIVRPFARKLASLINQRTSDFTSVERSPSRRRGKVYVDFLQNSEGQTLAAPYSVRPTQEATISTPLHWDEVRQGLDPTDFSLNNISIRLDEVGDVWKTIWKGEIDIEQLEKSIIELSK